MVGDWVYLIEFKKPIAIFEKVLSIDFITNRVCLYNPETKETNDIDVGECNPVKLSRKILEKNGWSYKTADARHCNYYKCKGEKDTILFGADGLLTIEDFGTIEVKYVHQLQQALRLCGNEELANKFKV